MLFVVGVTAGLLAGCGGSGSDGAVGTTAGGGKAYTEAQWLKEAGVAYSELLDLRSDYMQSIIDYPSEDPLGCDQLLDAVNRHEKLMLAAPAAFVTDAETIIEGYRATAQECDRLPQGEPVEGFDAAEERLTSAVDKSGLDLTEKPVEGN